MAQAVSGGIPFFSPNLPVFDGIIPDDNCENVLQDASQAFKRHYNKGISELPQKLNDKAVDWLNNKSTTTEQELTTKLADEFIDLKKECLDATQSLAKCKPVFDKAIAYFKTAILDRPDAKTLQKLSKTGVNIEAIKTLYIKRFITIELEKPCDLDLLEKTKLRLERLASQIDESFAKMQAHFENVACYVKKTTALGSMLGSTAVPIIEQREKERGKVSSHPTEDDGVLVSNDADEKKVEEQKKP